MSLLTLSSFAIRLRRPSHWLLPSAALALLLTLPVHTVQARDGVEVGGNSKLASLVPAGQVEQSAQQQYAQLLQQAASKQALGVWAAETKG